MSSYLHNQITKCSTAFSSDKPYLTVTRKNGLEIITVTEGTIRITDLSSSDPINYSFVLNTNLTFEPTALVLNNSEELMCLYNESTCWVVSLNKPGCKVRFTTLYKLKLNLLNNEKIIQIIFNNISKFQSEIVILTNDQILSFDINTSLSTPAQVYNFKKEYNTNNNSNSFNIDSTIIDPVSITFASASDENIKSYSSQADLTLLLLTSDCSVYRIYPFFPQSLSVSKLWLTDLFDYTSLMFKSIVDLEDQTQMLLSVKVSALLSQTSGQCIIRKTLPEVYTKGKITGPLSISPFPDELYSQDAIKLVTLSNDIICIILDHSVLAMNYQYNGAMIFETQDVESKDSFLLVDGVNFNNGGPDYICDGIIHPVTKDSILLISSKHSFIQIDYSQWMDVFSEGVNNGDLTEFYELCHHEKLPTEVVDYGEMKIPKKPKKSEGASTIGFGLSSNTESFSDGEIFLRQNENKIWLAWNDKAVYAMVLNNTSDGILSIYLISAIEDEDEEQYNSTKYAEISKKEPDNACNDDDNKYVPLLNGNYSTEIVPELRKVQKLLIELENKMIQFPDRLLNEESIGSEDLKVIYQLGDLTSTGQISLFKTLSTLTRRLKMMSMEYRNQISTLSRVNLVKEETMPKFLELKTRYSSTLDRQKELNARLNKLGNNVNKIVLENNKSRDVALSMQEKIYFNELKKMKDFVEKKEMEREQVETLLKNVKQAEINSLIKSNEEILTNAKSTRKLANFKKKLDKRDQVIDDLVSELKNANIE